MDSKNKDKEIAKLEEMNYKYFKDHRDYLVEHKHNMENKFSQLLIYLSAGIFTISIWFSNIHNFDNYIILILASWFSSLLSLIFVLFSFKYSIKAYKNEIKAWDENKKNATEDFNTKIIKTKESLVNSWTWSLVISIVLLYLFYLLNFTT